MHLTMSFVNWWPYCLGLNVLPSVWRLHLKLLPHLPRTTHGNEFNISICLLTIDLSPPLPFPPSTGDPEFTLRAIFLGLMLAILCLWGRGLLEGVEFFRSAFCCVALWFPPPVFIGVPGGCPRLPCCWAPLCCGCDLWVGIGEFILCGLFCGAFCDLCGEDWMFCLCCAGCEAVVVLAGILGVAGLAGAGVGCGFTGVGVGCLTGVGVGCFTGVGVVDFAAAAACLWALERGCNMGGPTACVWAGGWARGGGVISWKKKRAKLTYPVAGLCFA